MGDLSGQTATEATRLVGSESDGTETNLAKVSPKQDLGTSDLQDNSFIHTVVEIDDAAPVALRVGGSNLVDRKEIGLENMGNQKVFIGGSSVSNSDGSADRGSTLEASAIRTFPYGPNITLYAIAKPGQTVKVIVWESA